MNIDITAFFNACTPMDFSASRAEIGDDAGSITWRAAIEESASSMLLDTAEKREAFRAFVRESGGWTAEEVAAFTDAELNALCIQWIAGDMREPVGFDLGPDTSEEQWRDYYRQSIAGNCSGRIYCGINGRVFFDIGG